MEANTQPAKPNRKKRLLTEKERSKALARHGKRKAESDERAQAKAEKKSANRHQRVVEEKQRALKRVASLRRSISDFERRIALELKYIENLDKKLEARGEA